MAERGLAIAENKNVGPIRAYNLERGLASKIDTESLNVIQK
jgi:hypothetical protein